VDLSVNVAGTMFFGRLPPSGEGFIISPDGFEGWDDSVSTRGETVNRSQGDGDFDVPQFLDTRIVSLSGFAIANSPTRLDGFGAQLRGTLARGLGRIDVEHMDLVKWANCRLAPGTQTKFKVSGANPTTAKFQIQLKMADPRIYGKYHQTARGTTVTSRHAGNFPADMKVIVEGVASSYRLTGPFGRQYVVTQPLTAGKAHIIEFANGRLHIDSAVVFNATSRAETWSCPPGQPVTTTIDQVVGNATIQCEVIDTYI
jgi:hypothetical protein